MILDKINKTGDIKKVPKNDYDALAEEIREFLLEKTSVTGGHLAANLGVVELTMALHLSLSLPTDKIVWDVGHQSYTHKILTGRKAGFDQLRQFNGMSGFPKRRESASDSFDTGHSSTSIAAALGMAVSRDLQGGKNTIVAVIGDGSLSGGMAYEALNNAAELKTNLIIILNDNEMSISPSIGGVSRSLTRLRTSIRYNEIKNNVAAGISNIPMVGAGLYHTISNTKKTIKQAALKNGMFFEEMGITYLGPYDGHNVVKLVEAIQQAKKVKGPVLVHVLTKKGYGYKPAEENPSDFHGVAPFDIKTGKPLSESTALDYTTVFGKKMLALAEKDPRVVAITAAMPGGTGLLPFSKKYPERFFDVGIAEEHAVTFAAGLAVSGMKPVFAVYSSFLQRSYDQLLHDVALQDLPVIFALDRAGLVGPDGETHHGVFDLSYLSNIPGMTVMAPKNGWELEAALDFAMNYDHPIAIRYPKGAVYTGVNEYKAPMFLGKAETIVEGENIAILAVGSMVKVGMAVTEKLQNRGITPALINARFVAPLDVEMLEKVADNYSLIVTLEENVMSGGFGEKVATYLKQHNSAADHLLCAVPDSFIGQGTVAELMNVCELDADHVTERILEKLNREC